MGKAMPAFNLGFDSSSVAQALGRLLAYLCTWQNDNGLFGGMIATWWSSTVETAEPHPMNQFPMILGFLELHRGNIKGGDWLSEACKVGDGLVGMIEPDGMLKNCWGDIPGKSTGTVIFACPALALSELYKSSQNEKYLQGSKILLDTIERKWSWDRRNIDGVANQALKWCEAMLSYGEATGKQDYIEHALWLGNEVLEQQVMCGRGKGAFYQSRVDDRLISVYQGKCLTPLLAIYEHSKKKIFLDASVLLGKYLIGHELEKGIFINYLEPSGAVYKILWQILCRFDYRIFRRRVPTFRLWRHLIKGWTKIDYPSFIARSADSIRGLWLLSKYDSYFREHVENLTKKILGFQLPHGGFPNTIGFDGSTSYCLWQDICCPTRWNAYVFFLLATIIRELKRDCIVAESQFSGVPFEHNVGKDNSHLYMETSDKVEIYSKDTCVAGLSKPEGIAYLLNDKLKGDLSGHRGRKNLNDYEC